MKFIQNLEILIDLCGDLDERVYLVLVFLVR